MAANELENLVKAGVLQEQVADALEVDGLLRSGAARLHDAENAALSLESRFDLAYNAAHALSLAALRRAGFRSANRYAVFQSLPHTLGLPPSVWRVLATAHGARNTAEYEGYLEIDDRIVADTISAAKVVLAELQRLRWGFSTP